jgi:1,4-dihydroxy-2-naphthoate polyprenyltransferase
MTSRATRNSAQDLARIEALRRLPHPALWAIAARLKTLSLSLAPVAAGTWYAASKGSWQADILVTAGLGAVAIQVGTNLWNDAADAARGVDTQERLGPPRVTALGLLPPTAVRTAAALSFLVAALAGLYLAAIGGAVIIAIGLASLAMGYLYSMGPLPLSMTPLGELLVIIYFGICAVAGTAFLHDLYFDIRAVELGAILGLPAAAVLLLNNHRDRYTDAQGGRRTLAILIGEKASRLLYAGLLFATVAGIYWWKATSCSSAVIWSLILLAMAGALSWRMGKTPVSSALNQFLPLTALFQLVAVAALAIVPPGC